MPMPAGCRRRRWVAIVFQLSRHACLHAWYYHFLHPLAPRLAARRPSPAACCPLHCLCLYRCRAGRCPRPRPRRVNKSRQRQRPFAHFRRSLTVNKHPHDKHFISSIQSSRSRTPLPRLGSPQPVFCSHPPAQPRRRPPTDWTARLLSVCDTAIAAFDATLPVHKALVRITGRFQDI